MSKATRLIKHLNKIINDYNNFGDNLSREFHQSYYAMSYGSSREFHHGCCRFQY